MSVISAPSPKWAISYDPEAKCLIREKAEIIGIVQLENPEEEGELQLLPCYLVSNKYGFFWVPELEYNFIMYEDYPNAVNATSDYIKNRIIEIEAVFVEAEKEATTETVEVEVRGNVSKIRRIKFVKKDETDDT